jgi:hypothetical protein
MKKYYKMQHPFRFQRITDSCRGVKRRILKKRIRRFLKYTRNVSNEFGFLVLPIRKKWSKLPANIFIDDNGFWINLGNKKIILFQTNNNEECDFNKTLPMTVENEPKILVTNEKIDLQKFEIEEIKNFVIKCQNQILQIAEGKIDLLEFFKILNDKGFY